MYWQTAPPRTASPYITYNLVSQPAIGVCLAGEGNLRRQIWQFDVWVESDDDPSGEKLEATAAAVEASLLDYSGPIGATTVHTVDRAGGRETFAPPLAGDERPINRVMMEFDFVFEA